MNYLIASFLIYFLFLLLIGLSFHRRQTSSADFMIGSRSLNFWVVALSAHASDMSAWLFMGLPMAVFLLGISQVWIAVGLLIGMYLNWHLVAPKLRTETEKYGCYTLSSFFEKRFNDQTGSIQFISAIMLLLFLMHYLSAGMIGIGNLLESVFQLNYYMGLILALSVVLVYTFVGGFIAVAWTDLFQGLFLLVMIIIVPLLAFLRLENGTEEIITLAQIKGIHLSLIPEWNLSAFFSFFLVALSWGLGYFGMPHVITKFMGIKDVADMHKSKWIGMTWQLIVLLAAILTGVIAIAYFPLGLTNPELVFIDMVKDLFHPFFAGFILCAVLAASMSTMDSQILVCASIISEDLYTKWGGKEMKAEIKLKISRYAVVLVSLIALFLSLNRSKTIMDTVSYSWAGLGSSFGPLVLSSLYSKKVNRYGAIAGILTGGTTVMLWPYVNTLWIAYPIPSMIPSFFLSLTMIHAVSYAAKIRESEEPLFSPSQLLTRDRS